MDSLPLLYQLASSDQKTAAKVRFHSLLRTCLKNPEKFEKIGMPAWQVRWFLKRLGTKSIQGSFERKVWPEIFLAYTQGPVSDLYFGISAAIYSIDPDTDPFKPVFKKLLSRMERELIEVDGVSGWSFDGSEPRYDLGTAHGLTSSVLALSLIAKRLGLDSRVSSLSKTLEESFERIYRKGRIEILKTYPKSTQSLDEGRVGWCRSDLSTGIALWVAGKRLESPRMIKTANRYLERTKTHSPAKLYTENPYLCHGSAGNQYLFFLAHELTGDPWFKAKSQSAARVTQRYLASKKFPRNPVGAEYHLMDLRNTQLVERSIQSDYDRSWDIVFAYRDPYDLTLT